jgi:phosphatidate cytidylyltransferase
MLKARVITALALFITLVLVLFSKSFFLFAALLTVFFTAAIWESGRLSGNRYAVLGAGLWGAFFVWVFLKGHFPKESMLFGACAAIWALRLAPSLAIGLPPLRGLGSSLLNAIYAVAILGCFVAIAALFTYSPFYLLSVLMIVWVADTGAYFSGKSFGKRKLAPTISPGKSWEGAIGGWLCVLLLGATTVALAPSAPILAETFAVKVQLKWGWPGFLLVLSLVVAASIAGDLFESQLKRRAGVKDSSNLLPGHGGVLDRIDALIPVLPLAALLNTWLVGAAVL